MKLLDAAPLVALSSAALLSSRTASAFVVVVVGVGPTATASASAVVTHLNAEIRPPTDKNNVLEYGWDGTTALGGAVVDSKPARLLDQIRASGETQSDACELFNANLGEFFVRRSFVASLGVVRSRSRKEGGTFGANDRRGRRPGRRDAPNVTFVRRRTSEEMGGGVGC